MFALVTSRHGNELPGGFIAPEDGFLKTEDKWNHKVRCGPSELGSVERGGVLGGEKVLKFEFGCVSETRSLVATNASVHGQGYRRSDQPQPPFVPPPR